MRRAAAALALVAVLCAPARARLYPPAKPGLAARGVPVVDERGRAFDLAERLRGAGPAILIPVFTRCGASCPILAESLKSALDRERVRFRVVVFSFDASDRDVDLASFRRELSLPEDWTVARAAGDGPARDFLDQFDYAFMKSGGGFTHPEAMLVLSPRGRWSATFVGREFAPGELAEAARRAEDEDSPSPWARLRRGLARPQAWAALGLAGLLAVVAAAAFLSPRASSRGGRGPTSPSA